MSNTAQTPKKNRPTPKQANQGATFQDVLNALTNQRNEALNAVAMAQAELAALRRSLEEPEEPQSERTVDEQE